jgi:AcrR family transcriptional regulator
MPKPDQPDALSRRVRQTRDQIETAFGMLFAQRSYDNIRIEDITEQACVARTTFYLHYASKDELFLGWMRNKLMNTDIGLNTRDEWLSEQPSPQFSTLFHKVQRDRRHHFRMLLDTKDAVILMHGMDNLIAEKIEARLHATFDETHSQIPFAVLAQVIAGGLTQLVQWWGETSICTAEEAARYAQRIISTTVRGALQL